MCEGRKDGVCPRTGKRCPGNEPPKQEKEEREEWQDLDMDYTHGG